MPRDEYGKEQDYMAAFASKPTSKPSSKPADKGGGKKAHSILSSMVDYFKEHPDALKGALAGAGMGAMHGGKKGAMIGGLAGLALGSQYRNPPKSQATMDLLAGKKDDYEGYELGPRRPKENDSGDDELGRPKPVAPVAIEKPYNPPDPWLESLKKPAAPAAPAAPEPSAPSGGGSIWTPEERAKFKKDHEARMAAAKAMQGGGATPPMSDGSGSGGVPGMLPDDKRAPMSFEDKVGQAATSAMMPMSEEERRHRLRQQIDRYGEAPPPKQSKPFSGYLY